ncbi:MAG TPA: hypothetical protein VMU48_11940 [Terracidiphilus sp.]|nr:hypothetical protein [Terracidiphilus sp.]
MLGTHAAVAQALDRSVDHAKADADIAGRLRNIPRQDAAWSSIEIGSGKVRSHLGDHTDEIEHCLGSRGEFVLGILPASTTELDMRTVAATRSQARDVTACIASTLYSNTHLVSLSTSTRDGAELKVKLSREEYERWLNGFSKRKADELLEAVVGASGIPAQAGSGR